MTGEVKIGDDTYYFAKDGKQSKGQTVSAGNGRISYYYGDSVQETVSTWVEDQQEFTFTLIRMVLLTT